jgi:succinoglycan biosynthesis protein ExoV
MELFYYKSLKGNFGDDINPWLWPRIFPNFNDKNRESLLLGIGTILDSRIPQKTGKVVVLGAGVRDPNNLPVVGNNWDIVGVRGPLSANVLKLEKEKVIGDPAYLLRRFYIPKSVEKKYAISYMSHMSCENQTDWRSILKEIGINFISPNSSVEMVCNEILKSELVISEAMHGVIVADAFRIPWIPVKAQSRFFEEKVNSFKWTDWSRSIGLNIVPYELPVIWQEKSIIGLLKKKLKILLIRKEINEIAKKKPFMSSSNNLDNVINKLDDAVTRVSKRYF